MSLTDGETEERSPPTEGPEVAVLGILDKHKSVIAEYESYSDSKTIYENFAQRAQEKGLRNYHELERIYSNEFQEDVTAKREKLMSIVGESYDSEKDTYSFRVWNTWASEKESELKEKLAGVVDNINDDALRTYYKELGPFPSSIIIFSGLKNPTDKDKELCSDDVLRIGKRSLRIAQKHAKQALDTKAALDYAVIRVSLEEVADYKSGRIALRPETLTTLDYLDTLYKKFLQIKQPTQRLRFLLEAKIPKYEPKPEETLSATMEKGTG